MHYCCSKEYADWFIIFLVSCYFWQISFDLFWLGRWYVNLHGNYEGICKYIYSANNHSNDKWTCLCSHSAYLLTINSNDSFIRQKKSELANCSNKFIAEEINKIILKNKPALRSAKTKHFMHKITQTFT